MKLEILAVLALLGLLVAVAVAEPTYPPMPDASLTPGAIASTNQSEVCAEDGLPGSSYSRQHRHTTPEMKRAVLRAYGITPPFAGEIDHRVPLCLGGADIIANLWPQTDYRAKDALEAFACAAVCRHHTSLGEAQSWFLGDWRLQLYRIRQ